MIPYIVPAHLNPPRHDPRGPDGRGWNRLSLGWSLAGPQCALRPRTVVNLALLWSDPGLIKYGGLGHCVRPSEAERGIPDCRTCPILTAPSERLGIGSPALVRVLPTDDRFKDDVFIMNKPEDGFASRAKIWSWDRLARLEGWGLGVGYRDEHSRGFWIRREVVDEEARRG